MFFGIAGALVGTAAYAAFAVLTGQEVVYVSVLLGAIAGWSVRLANSSLRRVWASTIGVLLTLCALLVSDYLMGRQVTEVTGGPLLPSADSFSFVERDHLTGDPLTYVFSLTGSSYPGDTAIQEESDPQCGDSLPAYTGDHASENDFSYYTPDQFSWSLGDRVVACALIRAPGSDLEAIYGKKLRGTARSTP